MRSLVKAIENSERIKALNTYKLIKNETFFGYGIAFHTENIPISESYHKLVYPLIGIEIDSPAFNIEMKNGQRIVAVNGEFVNNKLKSLEDVVQAIEDSYYSRNFTKITVLEPNEWNELIENPILAAALADSKYSNDELSCKFFKIKYPFLILYKLLRDLLSSNFRFIYIF